MAIIKNLFFHGRHQKSFLFSLIIIKSSEKFPKCLWFQRISVRKSSFGGVPGQKVKFFGGSRVIRNLFSIDFKNLFFFSFFHHHQFLPGIAKKRLSVKTIIKNLFFIEIFFFIEAHRSAQKKRKDHYETGCMPIMVQFPCFRQNRSKIPQKCRQDVYAQ